MDTDNLLLDRIYCDPKIHQLSLRGVSINKNNKAVCIIGNHEIKHGVLIYQLKSKVACKRCLEKQEYYMQGALFEKEI